MRRENDCVCCPYLRIIPCGDTDEHKHPGCEIVGMIANVIVKEVCLEDFQDCPNLSEIEIPEAFKKAWPSIDKL